MHCVMPWTANFEAAYWTIIAVPVCPTTEERLMIRPLRCAINRGARGRVVRNTPRALMSMTRSHSCSVISTNGPGFGPTPALLTRMSSRPNRSWTARSSAEAEAAWRTSCSTAKASPGSSSAVACAPARFMSAITTAAPSRLRASAMPRPRPLAPPVTTATFSSSAAISGGVAARLENAARHGFQEVVLAQRRMELADHGVPVEHEHAVAHARHLVEVGRRVQDDPPGVGDLPHDLHQVRLGTDVDAARRVVEEHEVRSRLQPFAEEDLLLVAARQRRYGKRVRAGDHPQPLAPLLGPGLLGAHAGQEAETTQRPGGDHRDVLEDRGLEDQPVGLAIGRHVRHARADRPEHAPSALLARREPDGSA